MAIQPGVRRTRLPLAQRKRNIVEPVVSPGEYDKRTSVSAGPVSRSAYLANSVRSSVLVTQARKTSASASYTADESDTICRVKGTLARKVLAVPAVREGTRFRESRHLAAGTAIDVLSQRASDSRVEIRLIRDQSRRVYLVPADAVDAATARALSIHRPPRHRRSSGGSLVPVDWKGSGASSG